MFHFADKPQSIGEVLADSFKLYRFTFLKILPLSFCITLISAIPSISGLLTGHTEPVTPMTMQQFMQMPNLLVIAFEALATPILMALLMYGMHVLSLNRSYTLTSLAKAVFARMIPLFFTFITSTAVIMLGFMFLVFPGIFVAVLWMFAIPLVILDKQGGFAALGQSANLVWGHWWKTFLTILMPLLLSLFTLAVAIGIAKQNQLLLIVLNIGLMGFLTPLFYAVILVQLNTLKQLARHSQTG